MCNQSVLIIGANSGIANAIIKHHLALNHQVYAVSRDLEKNIIPTSPLLHWFTTDHSEADIASITHNSFQDVSFYRIYICTGKLHDEHFMPEKRLEDCSIQHSQESFMVNAILPLLWLKALKPKLRKPQSCVVTVFSARVGSINDNRAGGWYSYRAAKAALNMLLRSASIEFSQCNKQIKLLAFHPGTVDTALSDPFQKNISEAKIFKPNFVVECLDQIINDINFDGELSYLDWAGETIEY